jgi:hypothetical protein
MGLYKSLRDKGGFVKKFLLFFLCYAAFVQAGSLRLQNESVCPLKAIIQGADGTVLSEMLVGPQEIVSWNDSKGKSPSKSQTPYQVYWYCLDGESFCVCEHVSTGSFVKTGYGVGRKSCNSSKKETKEES